MRRAMVFLTFLTALVLGLAFLAVSADRALQDGFEKHTKRLDRVHNLDR